jgi:hypothetical protein
MATAFASNSLNADQLISENGQLQTHFLKLPFGNGATDETSPCGEIQTPSLGMTAADRDAQLGISSAVDPPDRSGVIPTLKRLQRSQPGHRFSTGQSGNGRGGMQLFGECQHRLSLGSSSDWCVEMGEAPMARQLGLGPAPG